MPKFVYMVEFDWSTEENSDKEIQLYSNYADAVKRFNEIIANELNPEMSWVGNSVFREDGSVNDGFTFTCCTDAEGEGDLWWYVARKGDSNIRSFIDLKKIEIS